MKTTVFLGGGRITGALLAGLRLAGSKTPILVHDRNAHKLRTLEREYGVAVEANLGRAVARADLLIVAVRPNSVSEVLGQVRQLRAAEISKRNQTAPPLLACSLAAGVPLSDLRAQLGRPVLWCRAMPSPAARSGRGLTALTFERSFPKTARGRMMKFFRQVGPVLEISERKFDAFMVTFSPSHGYHALATMAQAAQNLGLDRQTAFTAAAHSLADAIASWREGGESLEGLLREAATPGGIAATVMNTMVAAGYARTVERAFRAGIERGEKIAKA